MSTQFPSAKEVTRAWHVIDAENAILGRLASRAATLLMGKHKPIYTPFLDTGDHVIVVNAAKVRVTGRKEEQKVYRRHSGYPGGLKEVGLRKLSATRPDRVIREAVLGMLPKNKLRKRMAARLLIYSDDRHPHQAQKPEPVVLGAAK